jgi:hypothetical protein
VNSETVEHSTSACPILAKEQYIQGHDTVCAELHCNMCKVVGGNYTTDSFMATYRNPNNKPDIIIRDNKQGTFISIDVAFLADRNVIKKETEVILKYEYLAIEIQRTWNVKANAIPVITGRLEPSQNHSHNT